MKRPRGTLSLIQAAFPGRERLIERAYSDNRPFRELCDDYRKCVGALERWKQLESDRPVERSHEYTELLGELRSEIETWLQAMETGSYGTSGLVR